MDKAGEGTHHGVTGPSACDGPAAQLPHELVFGNDIAHVLDDLQRENAALKATVEGCTALSELCTDYEQESEHWRTRHDELMEEVQSLQATIDQSNEQAHTLSNWIMRAALALAEARPHIGVPSVLEDLVGCLETYPLISSESTIRNASPTAPSTGITNDERRRLYALLAQLSKQRGSLRQQLTSLLGTSTDTMIRRRCLAVWQGYCRRRRLPRKLQEEPPAKTENAEPFHYGHRSAVPVSRISLVMGNHRLRDLQRRYFNQFISFVKHRKTERNRKAMIQKLTTAAGQLGWQVREAEAASKQLTSGCAVFLEAQAELLSSLGIE